MEATIIPLTMAGKLIIVEGATGSGKSTLLAEFSKRDAAVVRGIASQNPQENGTLVPAARDVLGGLSLNFTKILAMPKNVREDILARCIDVARIQHQEALKLKPEGHVFLNRSAISLIALLRMAEEVGIRNNDHDLINSSRNTENKVRQMMDGMNFMSEVDGIVLLEKPYIAPVSKEREGMRGLEAVESHHIGMLARDISWIGNIPSLEINANEMSIEKEVDLVSRRFNIAMS